MEDKKSKTKEVTIKFPVVNDTPTREDRKEPDSVALDTVILDRSRNKLNWECWVKKEFQLTDFFVRDKKIKRIKVKIRRGKRIEIILHINVPLGEIPHEGSIYYARIRYAPITEGNEIMTKYVKETLIPIIIKKKDISNQDLVDSLSQEELRLIHAEEIAGKQLQERIDINIKPLVELIGKIDLKLKSAQDTKAVFPVAEAFEEAKKSLVGINKDYDKFKSIAEKQVQRIVSYLERQHVGDVKNLAELRERLRKKEEAYRGTSVYNKLDEQIKGLFTALDYRDDRLRRIITLLEWRHLALKEGNKRERNFYFYMKRIEFISQQLDNFLKHDSNKLKSKKLIVGWDRMVMSYQELLDFLKSIEAMFIEIHQYSEKVNFAERIKIIGKALTGMRRRKVTGKKR